jgi:hypothetical protein
MTSIVSGLLPVFVLIFLGTGLRKYFFKDEAFWRPLEQLAYYVLFPALLISNISEATVDWARIGPVLAVLIGSLVIVALVLLVVRRCLGTDGPGFTSVFQGAIRFNSYVGLSVAGALHGKEGIAFLSVIMAFMIPLINLFSVSALTRYARSATPTPASFLRDLALNPLILGSLAGLAMSLAHVPPPPLLRQALEILGKATLPLGLLAVGAGLRRSALTDNGVAQAGSAGLKLLLFPLLGWAGSRAAGLDQFATSVVVMFTSLPTATSAFILARCMGGDYRLMAGIITTQTVAAAVTLPLVLMLLR